MSKAAVFVGQDQPLVIRTDVEVEAPHATICTVGKTGHGVKVIDTADRRRFSARGQTGDQIRQDGAVVHAHAKANAVGSE